MRYEAWPELLTEAIESMRDTPFEWGAHDCSLFAASCVKAITGEDRAEWRGKYSTLTSAKKKIANYGGIEEVAKIVFGGDELNILEAQRGDGVIAETQGTVALGICLGADCAFVTLEGLVFISTTQCLKAWRVG